MGTANNDGASVYCLQRSECKATSTGGEFPNPPFKRVYSLVNEWVTVISGLLNRRFMLLNSSCVAAFLREL